MLISTLPKSLTLAEKQISLIMLLTFIARCRVAWGKLSSSCPSSSPAHAPLPPEEDLFTIRAPGARCSVHAKPGSQPSVQCNDRALVHWMCSVTTMDQVSWQDFLERMPLDNLAKLFRTCRLRWYDGHVDGWLKKVQKLNPIGGRGCGRPNKTWTEVIGRDRLGLGITETHPSDRKKLGVVDLKCSQTGSTRILGTKQVQYKLNSDSGSDSDSGDGDGDDDGDDDDDDDGLIFLVHAFKHMYKNSVLNDE